MNVNVRRLVRWLAYAGATWCVSVALTQSLGFEAASIRTVSLDARYLPRYIAPRMDNPRRFHARADAIRLIEWAYGVRDFQIMGGPAWTHDGTVRYEVQAVAGAPSSEAEMRRMLQTLLRDRFGLRWHAEKREMPVYLLEVGRNGPRLNTASAAPQNGGEGTVDIGKGVLIARAIEMGTLVQIMTENMDRPVIDRTGLAGRYDLDLRYDPGSLVDWRLAPALPSMMQDVGLKIEAEKSMVDVFAIDGIQRPTEN